MCPECTVLWPALPFSSRWSLRPWCARHSPARNDQGPVMCCYSAFGCTRRPGAAGIRRTRATFRREQLARLPQPLHPSGAGRFAACGSRPARSRPATRIAPAFGTRLTLPGQLPQCRLRPTVTVHPCLRSVTHSLRAGPRGAHSLVQGLTVSLL